MKRFFCRNLGGGIQLRNWSHHEGSSSCVPDGTFRTLRCVKNVAAFQRTCEGPVGTLMLPKKDLILIPVLSILVGAYPDGTFYKQIHDPKKKKKIN